MFQNIKEWNKGFEDAGSVVLPFHAHLATKNNGFHWFPSQFQAGLYNNKYYIHRQDILLSDIDKIYVFFMVFNSYRLFPICKRRYPLSVLCPLVYKIHILYNRHVIYLYLRSIR